jgi:hypothetical protein
MMAGGAIFSVDPSGVEVGWTMAEGEGLAGLSDAIRSLRSELTTAWLAGEGERVRFRPAPIELTLQVGVTAEGSGSAGVHWWLFSLGGERSQTTAATQTLKMTLEPVLVDEQGQQVEFLIDGADVEEGTAPATSSMDDLE